MGVEGIRAAFVPGGAARNPPAFSEPAAGDQSHSHQFVNMLSWVFTQKCQRALCTAKKLIHPKINYFQNRGCG